MLDELGITQKHQRLLAWIVFSAAAIVGGSLAGWLGVLVGLVGVPIAALAVTIAGAVFFGALTLFLDGLAWMLGCEMDGWAFKKIKGGD